MSLALTILSSGSSGNSTLLTAGDRHVLIDVGLSGRETVRRLGECGLRPEDISAIVVSHEHGDHCRGIAAFSKDLQIPVFITDGACEASGLVLAPGLRQRIESGLAFDVHGILFTPFAVPHDAADPIGLRIETGGVKIAIAVDLGYVSNLVVERLRGCDAIVLESNHDVNMLKVGPYPWQLKQRVMSRRGHLSNDSVADYLLSGYDGCARHVVLAHLSKKNNLPELALLSASQALEARNGLRGTQTRIHVAAADTVNGTIKL
jgi:phosphoribosyl 1,2-cyclic phosphodiesterase